MRLQYPLMPPRMGIVGLLVAAAAIGPAELAGQPIRLGQYSLVTIPRELLERPLPLRTGIGTAHETVATTSARAQAFYDQGLAYLHSYAWIEAARSFHEALRIDGHLAMAHLGLSYALGELGSPVDARTAADRANALAAEASARERARIAIRTRQLAASAAPDNPRLRTEYITALDDAVNGYPEDVELLLLRGQATASIADYERAIALAPDYFAAHHYLAHALENAARWEPAREHAAAYARLAPAVPHAHHMHGHGLRQTDHIDEAIVEFQRADELGTQYAATEHIPPEFDWQYHHNLDLLGAACVYAGRMRGAQGALRRSFELPSIELSQELSEKAWPAFLLARGRPADALSASRALAARPRPIVQALGHLLASRALMALQRMDDAIIEGDRARGRMQAAGAIGGVLVPDLQLTQAELLLRTGQQERGRAMMREAVAKLAADRSSDAWMQSLFGLETAARVARDAGDATLADEVAEAMQRFDDRYAGTHYALGRAAEHRGNPRAAAAAYTEAIRRWHAADEDLPELADARRRLAALNGSKP